MAEKQKYMQICLIDEKKAGKSVYARATATKIIIEYRWLHDLLAGISYKAAGQIDE
jgi:hypothetical protein